MVTNNNGKIHVENYFIQRYCSSQYGNISSNAAIFKICLNNPYRIARIDIELDNYAVSTLLDVF